jgi:hypothetical protein
MTQSLSTAIRQRNGNAGHKLLRAVGA